MEISKNIRRLKRSLYFGGVGIFVGMFFSLLVRNAGFIVEAAILGFFVGFIIGLLEELFNKTAFRRISFKDVLLLRTIAYTVVFLFVFAIFASIRISITEQCLIWESFKGENLWNYVYNNNIHIIFILLISFSLLSGFIWQINLLLGRGVLLKYITGRYLKPKEEERFFMFLDLTSSTTIAEKLGKELYSSFLQDFFFDISEIIEEAKGEIFQYCGDEVVIVWKRSNGIKNSNVINLFFRAKNRIAELKNKYYSKYGVVPSFKAGLHFGNILITEVGNIKKEIAYHGDLINTAARIRSTCNKLGEEILVSKDVKEIVPLDGYDVKYLGKHILKGKSIPVDLYSLSVLGFS